MKYRLSIITLLFVVLFSSCREFKEVQLTGVDNFHINKINTEGIDGEVKLKIKNPNHIGFSIYPSAFDVTYSGIRLGQAKLKKRVHIGANSEKVYTFYLKTKFENLNLLDATKLLNLNNIGNIELAGDLKAGKWFVKKRFPVNFKEKVNLLK